MRRLPDLRNPAFLAMALCLALGGTVQAGWTTCVLDLSQSPERWQPARGYAAIGLSTRLPQARADSVHRTPVPGLKFAGSPAGAAPQVSVLSADGGLPFPHTCEFTPRSGRSPPLSSRQ